MKYQFIKDHQDSYSVSGLCRALNVSRCGYYAWISRAPSVRAHANALLREKIKCIHQQYRQTCGSDKTWALLKQQGIACGRHRVARLRRQQGIEAIRMKLNLPQFNGYF